MKRKLRLLVLMAGLTVATSGPVLAAEHLMVIQEVSSGTPSNPAAQYVMLRMTSFAQTLLNGTVIDLQDSSGAAIGRFGTFDHNVASGGTAGCAYPNCPAIVIGTAAAQTAFGFAFDQIVDAQTGRASLPPAGGRVCYKDSLNRPIDCVAYGSFSGSNTIPTPTINGCDANFGVPATALSAGFSLTRKQFSCAIKENSADFENRFPHPVANNGGNANTDSDGDTLIDILDCADGDSSALYFPFEVSGLTVSDPPTSLVWGDQAALSGISTLYDVLTGSIATLRTMQDYIAEMCLVAGSAAASTSDPGSNPSLGNCNYYLARARSNCGPGTYGDGTSIPDPRNLLDDPVNGPACP